MKKILFILLALTVTFASAQKRKKRKKKQENPYAVADKFFKNYNYFQANQMYKDFVKSGDSSLHLLKRIGDCYYNNSKVKEASIWYEKALEKYPKKINSEYLYKYLLTQRSLGKFDKADSILLKFEASKTKNDKRVDAVLNDTIPNRYELLLDTEQSYVTYKEAPFNTKYSDFGAYKKDSILYFSSSRVKDSITDPEFLYSWNKEPFLNIYKNTVTEENDSLKYSDPAAVFPTKGKTPSVVHEASVAISEDGKTMYYTRDNTRSGKRKKYNKRGTTHLRLYRATKNDDGSWGNPEDLSINDDEASTGHPAISADGKYLFFVSDREGGFGQTDIYKSRINKNGTFGPPQNLGRNVNSRGREMFPFIAKDSTLYFSSDAHINLGLLDIFKSNVLRKDSDEEKTPINMGAPYNSGFDDFAFYVDSKTNKGYFSSNRPGGTGSDDIYEFVKFECQQTVVGYAKDEKTKEPLDKVMVKLIDATGKVIDSMKTKDDGFYKFDYVDCDRTFTITGERIIYRPDSKELKTSVESDKENKMEDLLLVPLIQDNEIVINPIFFDLAKHDIRPDAAYELENIVVVMKEHPKMHIKIEAHTDSRGRDAYNEALSDRRAKSTQNYLYSRGIEEERIESAIGYGEKFLLNDCGNGVKCTEEEHQKNRRSKFIITKFK